MKDFDGDLDEMWKCKEDLEELDYELNLPDIHFNKNVLLYQTLPLKTILE